MQHAIYLPVRGDHALLQGGSAYGLEANIGNSNFPLTRLRSERHCWGRMWSRLSPWSLWTLSP